MKENKWISIINGFLITGFILFLMTLLFFVLTFKFIGGETLQEIENQRTSLLFFSFLTLGLTILLCIHYNKSKQKYKAIGIGALPILSFILIVIYYINSFNYSTPYNQAIWKIEKQKPFDMAATLVKEQQLIGLSRATIKELLGKGNNENYKSGNTNRCSIQYSVKPNWTLTIVFDNEVCTQVYLRLPSMMT